MVRHGALRVDPEWGDALYDGLHDQYPPMGGRCPKDKFPIGVVLDVPRLVFVRDARFRDLLVDDHVPVHP